MSGTAYSEFYGVKNVTRSLHSITQIHGFGFEQQIQNQLANQGECTVLDIGSGNSSFTIELANRFPDASFYAVDICPDEVRGFDPAKRPKNIHFDVQDGNALEFTDRMFDLVTATWSVSKYLPNDFADRPTTYITEIARVLKLGGIATIRPELSVFNYMTLDAIEARIHEADYPNKEKIARKITDYRLVRHGGVSVQFLDEPNRVRMTRCS